MACSRLSHLEMAPLGPAHHGPTAPPRHCATTAAQLHVGWLQSYCRTARLWYPPWRAAAVLLSDRWHQPLGRCARLALGDIGQDLAVADAGCNLPRRSRSAFRATRYLGHFVCERGTTGEGRKRAQAGQPLAAVSCRTPDSRDDAEVLYCYASYAGAACGAGWCDVLYSRRAATAQW
jgi:hypothetical protein